MDWLSFFIFFVTCFVAASTGALFPPDEWYKSLQKPSWNPPDWLFPIAWSILYIIIAYVGMRISIIGGEAPFAIGLWALQICLNTIWTPIFFGLHKIRLAMGFILGLWTTVFIMVLSYSFIDVLSSVLLVPYFIWVSFAAVLNYKVMVINKA